MSSLGRKAYLEKPQKECGPDDVLSVRDVWQDEAGPKRANGLTIQIVSDALGLLSPVRRADGTSTAWLESADRDGCMLQRWRAPDQGHKLGSDRAETSRELAAAHEVDEKVQEEGSSVRTRAYLA